MRPTVEGAERGTQWPISEVGLWVSILAKTYWRKAPDSLTGTPKGRSKLNFPAFETSNDGHVSYSDQELITY